MSKISTKKFIEELKKWPIIYDQNHYEYKNCRKRDKIFDKGIVPLFYVNGK